ncbi:hypothetical protein [Protaetiibacter intestinalis]|uniref:Uncharacterized protein n=1 Tax=Protaetiibacter intestinalis TaxID=2419774 RepID=A0A387B9V3_9MICO|nr:hypothetical protein [Protaetiibacter intestinalis]AYF99133.1 hypothetical protein D7I47_13270 [Protaetiibacter intestinalis]
MSLYSDFAPRRTVQIVADVVAIVVVIVAVLLGVAVHGAIAALGGVLVKLEEAGDGFQGTMGEIGDRLGEVPLIGDGIRGPFDSAAGAGGSLADAGRAGQTIVENIATAAGVGVALLPIAIVLLVWLWPRVRFARRAAETRALLRLEGGEQLLALRALDGAPAKELAAIAPHVVRGWQAGEPEVVRRLAALEAREAGVRLPAPAAP